MTERIDPSKYVNFEGRDWKILKTYLENKKEVQIGLLITARDNDKTNQIRGSLALLQELLALEKLAAE